jgi:hypothetical protein
MSSFPLPTSKVPVLAAALAVALCCAAPASRAEQLAAGDCQRLDAERRALIVQGIDKHFEKGAEWAKANLTVADLGLVKRYIELYESLKFQCQEEIAIVEVEEPDTVDEDDAPQTAAPGGATPKTNRKVEAAGQSSGDGQPTVQGTAPPIQDTTQSIQNTTQSVRKSVGANTTSIAKRPSTAAPAR